MKNIPPSDMLEVRAKVAALTVLGGERKDWGISRAWERDYLANVRTKRFTENIQMLLQTVGKHTSVIKIRSHSRIVNKYINVRNTAAE